MVLIVHVESGSIRSANVGTLPVCYLGIPMHRPRFGCTLLFGFLETNASFEKVVSLVEALNREILLT